MLHHALAHLEKSGTYVTVMIFEKPTEITDYLTERPVSQVGKLCFWNIDEQHGGNTGDCPGSVSHRVQQTSNTIQSPATSRNTQMMLPLWCFNNGQNSEYKDPVKVTKTTSC